MLLYSCIYAVHTVNNICMHLPDKIYGSDFAPSNATTQHDGQPVAYGKCSTISLLCYYSSGYKTVVVLTTFFGWSCHACRQLCQKKSERQADEATLSFLQRYCSMDPAAWCIIVVSVGVVIVVAMTQLHAPLMKANLQLPHKASLSATNPSGLLNIVSFSAEAAAVWESHRERCFVAKCLWASVGRQHKCARRSVNSNLQKTTTSTINSWAVLRKSR